MRHQLSSRDRRMAQTICTVCMGYLICNMPIIVYKLIRVKNVNENPYLLLFFSSLFWVQCSFNFIIYAARNKQFREAYFMYLWVVVFGLDDSSYFTTVTSTKGTNRRKKLTGGQNSQSNQDTNGSGKPVNQRVAFEKKHPKSSSTILQQSEPCPGSRSRSLQKSKSVKDTNGWPLLSKLPSHPVTQ